VLLDSDFCLLTFKSKSAIAQTMAASASDILGGTALDALLQRTVTFARSLERVRISLETPFNSHDL
jgi:hypothetical protein